MLARIPLERVEPGYVDDRAGDHGDGHGRCALHRESLNAQGPDEAAAAGDGAGDGDGERRRLPRSCAAAGVKCPDTRSTALVSAIAVRRDRVDNEPSVRWRNS